MDIDLLEDYIFHASGEDSNSEFPFISVPTHSPLLESVADDHFSDEEIVMTDLDQSSDSEVGLDKLMSDLEVDDDDEEMPNSEEDDPEEDPE